MHLRRISLLMFVVLLTLSLISFGQDSDFPVLKGSYLGQKPPGMTPEVFAPGIISTKATEGCSYFSREGGLFLFGRAGSTLNGILIMEQQEGIWSKPRLAPFSAGEHDWDFTLAPDGKTVFVASGRPISRGGVPLDNHKIWVSQRTDEGWSEPQLLPYPVNSGQHDSYPSVTEGGTLYFFSRRSGGLGQGDIYRSRQIDGQHTKIENLGRPINTMYHEVDPFVAPDESYLIFCSNRPGGYGNDDFYIVFRNDGKSWSDPINMGGKVNSPYQEYIPSVSPDGNYFFFTSNKSGDREIYWIDAKVIKDLNPLELK